MEESKMNVLHLGSGKVEMERFNKYGFVVHVDRSYKGGHHSPIGVIEDSLVFLNKTPNPVRQFFAGCDLFEFLDTYKFKFDLVIAERIFEHMEYCSGEIGRLLEAINMVTFCNGKLQIVVPDGLILAKMLTTYEMAEHMLTHTASLNEKMIINTEFCNIKCDPHGSVWTPKLAKEYIESEGTWEVVNTITPYSIGGRHIYMQLDCQKPGNNVTEEK